MTKKKIMRMRKRKGSNLKTVNFTTAIRFINQRIYANQTLLKRKTLTDGNRVILSNQLQKLKEEKLKLTQSFKANELEFHLKAGSQVIQDLSQAGLRNKISEINPQDFMSLAAILTEKRV